MLKPNRITQLKFWVLWYRYGKEAAKATHEGLDAAGHAVGTAWAVFKIRKALNPKSVIKPTTLAKSAAKAATSDKKKAKSSKWKIPQMHHICSNQNVEMINYFLDIIMYIVIFQGQ